MHPILHLIGQEFLTKRKTRYQQFQGTCIRVGMEVMETENFISVTNLVLELCPSRALAVGAKRELMTTIFYCILTL